MYAFSYWEICNTYWPYKCVPESLTAWIPDEKIYLDRKKRYLSMRNP